MYNAVDYPAIAQVCEQARERFPGARVEGRWYAGEPYAEVWAERDRAFTWTPEERA